VNEPTSTPKTTFNPEEFLKEAKEESKLKNDIFAKLHQNEEDNPKPTTD
tara:strand:+ start:438 stop:584 length:147 start_codon:yes stop_codon:yes gene_type:complete